MSLHAIREDAEPARWGPTHWESRLLAGSLRSVTVTLVHGADEAGRDDLLRRGVLPLLGRRIEDQAERHSSGSVLPFPDRRGAGPKRSASPELVLLLDDWSSTPLVPLAERIQIARSAAVPSTEGNSRLLLVLQGFETALDSAAKSVYPDPFWRELTAAAGDKPASVHLLLATGDPSTPALRWLARDLKGLGDHALRLDGAPSIAAPQLSSVPGLSGEAPEDSSEDDWLQGVDAALKRVVASARRGDAAPEEPQVVLPEPLMDSAPAPEPEPGPEPETAQAPTPAATPMAAPLQQSSPVLALATGKPTRRWLAPSLTVVMIVGLIIIWRSRPVDEPVVARQPAPAPALQATSPAPPPPPAASPAPAVRKAVEPGRALLQALSPLPTLDLRSGARQVAAELAIQGPPLLALVRYDALQRLPETRALAGVRIVAPLFIEPLQLWVRNDSPLTRLQDLLETSRIDTGRDGGDGLSAAGLRQALFGETRALAKPVQLADDAAIAALQQGKVDVLLRTRASALTEAAAADPGLRLLSLARDDAAGARVAHDYLPTASRATQGQTVPGVMSFLVVRGGDSAAGDQLAGQAMRALCAAALPGLRPDVALPAGRPYATAATQAAATCSIPRPQGDSR